MLDYFFHHLKHKITRQTIVQCKCSTICFAALIRCLQWMKAGCVPRRRLLLHHRQIWMKVRGLMCEWMCASKVHVNMHTHGCFHSYTYV